MSESRDGQETVADCLSDVSEANLFPSDGCGNPQGFQSCQGAGGWPCGHAATGGSAGNANAPMGGPGPWAESPPRCQNPRRGVHVWGTRTVPRPPIYPDPIGSSPEPLLRICRRTMAVGVTIPVTSGGVRQMEDGTLAIDALHFASDAVPSSGNMSG